jgi:23S rRNA pseudouridine2605 synthase
MRTPGHNPIDDDQDDFEDEDAGERDSLTDVPGGARLQKVMAEAGIGSRRYCEELIGAGRVEVDGETVRRFGARVDPDYQVIRVDGKRIPAKPGLAYLAFNKPPKVLTAMSDPRGRRTVADFLDERSERLFHIGRLDYDTEGLMLLTNDGELAHRLAHPSFEVAKTYLADVTGSVPKDLGRRGRGGQVPGHRPFRAARPGGDYPARGAQARGQADAGRRGAPGHPAGPHRCRPDQAGQPEAG